MSLPKCAHCQMDWHYGESVKNLLFLTCPYCKEKNYARKFRLRDILFSLSISIIMLFIFPFMDIPFLWRIIFGMVALIVYLLTYPVNLRLTKEEEPLF